MSVNTMIGRSRLDFTEDSIHQVPRVQYMSFEKMEPGMAPTSQPIIARPSPLLAANLDIPMRVYTLTPDTVIMFFGRKHWLSNFYEAPMSIGGHVYPSVEHYYEACKIYALVSPYQAAYIKNCRDPGQVKSFGKRLLKDVPKKVQEQWKTNEGLLVVRVGILEKFRQHAELRQKLFATDNKVLIQANKYDKLWASGMDIVEMKDYMSDSPKVNCPITVEAWTVPKFEDIGQGKNLLGHLLMYCRGCLRSEFGAQPTLPEITDQLDSLNIKPDVSAEAVLASNAEEDKEIVKESIVVDKEKDKKKKGTKK